MSRRQSVQRCRWGQTEEDRERAAQRAREEARRAAEAFLLGADAHTFALIELFGIPGVRRQLAENVEAYRAEVERMQRESMRRADTEALALAAANPSPTFRLVLYTGECERWRPEEYRRALVARRKRAETDLAKLGRHNRVGGGN